MADNIDVSPGSGKTVATEELGGAQYQKIKLVGGQPGSSSAMGVNPDGSINVSIYGIPTFLIGGSIAAVVTSNPNQSVSGAITAPPGSVMNTVHPAGSVTAVTFSGAVSVSGAVTAPPGSILTIAGVSGSVTAIRTDNASIIAVIQGSSIIAVATGNQSVSGAITAPPGSVMTIATLAGSILAVSGATTTTAGSIISSANPAGSVTAIRTDTASVITTQLPGSIMAVSGTITPSGNQSVSGAVTAPAGSVMTIATLAGSVVAVRTDIASVITTQPAGSILATTALQPAGSLLSAIQVAGSVMAVRTDLASVIAITTAVGSTIAILQAPSIVGTYAEDAAHTSADKGVFALQVRNDTMSSITSTDGDYSPQAVGPVGEVLTANSPITKWISGTADLRVVLGTSVQVLAAQGTSTFTYVTGVQVANLGPASVLVTIAGGLGSILAYTIAPAGGGSNVVYPNPLRTGENSKVTASLSGTASVLVSAQGFNAKI